MTDESTTENHRKSDDPFDVAKLRLDQSFASSYSVRKSILRIPVRKPHNTWYVRTNPDPDHRLATALLELKEERETYLVAKDLWPALLEEPAFAPKILIESVNRQGVVFLWPIRLPGEDGHIDTWSNSALTIAETATKLWVRLLPNRGAQCYDVQDASGDIPEPVFSGKPMNELLSIAFKDNYIHDHNDVVLARLRGQA